MNQEIILNFDFWGQNQQYSENSQSIVLVYQEKQYRVKIPHYFITLEQLKQFLSQHLFEQGIEMNSQISYCLDQSYKQLLENEVIQNFIHRVLYVQIIQLNQIKNQLYITNNHERLYYLNKHPKNLKKNQELSLQQISHEDLLPYKAFPKKNALEIQKILIIGPKKSPYQGGVFEIECIFQDDHPYTPTFNFKTPIYHLNIVEGCIPIVFKVDKDPQSTVYKSVLEILNLLEKPKFELVYNIKIAEQYETNQDIYNQIAESYTSQYAQPTIDQLVQGICDVNSESNILNKQLQDWIQQQQSLQKQKPIKLQVRQPYPLYCQNQSFQQDIRKNIGDAQIQQQQQLVQVQRQQQQNQELNKVIQFQYKNLQYQIQISNLNIKIKDLKNECIKQLQKKYGFLGEESWFQCLDIQGILLDNQCVLKNIIGRIGKINLVAKELFSSYKDDCLMTQKQVKASLWANQKYHEILNLKMILQSESYQENSQFKVFPVRSNLNVSKVFIFGPKNSPYEGGIFEILYLIKDEIPYRAPVFYFKTDIYHPNIEKGRSIEICLGWSPVLRLQDAIAYIINLLSLPSQDNCVNQDCAKEYQINRYVYRQKAQAYTKKYAYPSIYELMGEVIGDVSYREYNEVLILKSIFKNWIGYWRSV